MSNYFYDGQIRRYVTQFMRVFIGFQYKTGNELRHVPVMYGDMSRQVANIIKENSENKLPTVPRIACYISGLEMDTSRLTDPTFVSKVNIRERRWTETDIGREYQNVQGGGYTVERLMPTPFKLSMKADIWTSSIDQKLQLLEQILVLFNPSLEIQTTDNYIDWTSLSVLDLKTMSITSRSIPQGTESEIDICSMEFEMPVWITPPAKVKKLGIIQTIIANVFTDQGDVIDLQTVIYNGKEPSTKIIINSYRVLLLKSENGQPYDYELTVIDQEQAIAVLDLDPKIDRTNKGLDWNSIIELQGGYKPGNHIYFKQPTGYEMVGTYVINPIEPNKIIVTFDQDTVPTNTVITSSFDPIGKTYIDAIINPYKFNPLTRKNGRNPGIRYLLLDDVNLNNINQDGPDAWKNLDNTDPVIHANSIIEWSGTNWIEIFNPISSSDPVYIQNLKTGIQYRWTGEQWLRSFEGEYGPGFWGFLGN
jgi:hypothetical protein